MTDTTMLADITPPAETGSLWLVEDIWGNVFELTPEHTLDGDVYQLYTHGQCLAMAKSLCKHLGWEEILCVLARHDDGDVQLIHAWAIDPDHDLCCDIYGTRYASEAVISTGSRWLLDGVHDDAPAVQVRCLDTGFDFDELISEPVHQHEAAARHFANLVIKDDPDLEPKKETTS